MDVETKDRLTYGTPKFQLFADQEYSRMICSAVEKHNEQKDAPLGQ
jgi:hypothetical protein